MGTQLQIQERIRESSRKKILFLPHAVRQMSHPERMISTSEVRHILETGQIIEDYPEDARGHSCQILGFGTNNRPIHIVCSPKDDFLAIITAYLPSPKEWDQEFKVRTKL